MQLLLFSSALSPRLQYICHFIFKELMLVDFLITTDPAAFHNYDGPKIKYTNEAVSNDHLIIGSCGLLFENSIRGQDTRCFEVNNYTAFFKTENADLPFDLLAASFYLLSRYEEYLPYKKDIYGRYAYENSLAFKENFLHLPLINIWVNHLIKILQNKFGGFTIHPSPFTFLPTYDIDIAFAYKYKGWLRNTGGFIKSPAISRIKVLLGLDKDPFDSYDWLNELHSRNHLQPLYFFLLARNNGSYDKNILPRKKAMWKLVQKHAKNYTIGIHPSWQTGDKPALLKNEKEHLELMSGKTITSSRQHFIRFTLPDGYRLLRDNGIQDDYSMGYGSSNGFRASAASSFYWYDLQKNEPTLLRIHPFCFMDANSFYEQNGSPSEAYNELMQLYSICKEVNGQLITIWHNNFLGTDPQFAGWRSVYEQFILEVKRSTDPIKNNKLY
ncbi:MAG: polysaccharide deacetylase family protein [Ferruginibacter sp.]|nr:polysaccharide deacetylase family protein [Ferruginibacter sp.]